MPPGTRNKSGRAPYSRMVLIINCVLRNQLRDYTPFFNAIRANSAWWHFMDPTWIVNTNKTPHEFANLLYPHMENTDSLLVARLTGEYEGWLPKEAWEWLNVKNY